MLVATHGHDFTVLKVARAERGGRERDGRNDARALNAAPAPQAAASGGGLYAVPGLNEPYSNKRGPGGLRGPPPKKGKDGR